jgi:cardiolipin synthase
VRIFEYLPSILHAKLLIVDDFVLLGSTNFNHRSLPHDIEFDVVLSKPNTIKNAEDQYREDLIASREIKNDELKLMGLRRLAGSILWLLRYWL